MLLRSYASRLAGGALLFFCKKSNQKRQRQKKLRFCRGVHPLSFRTTVVPSLSALTSYFFLIVIGDFS
jgi:hypothetical protein